MKYQSARHRWFAPSEGGGGSGHARVVRGALTLGLFAWVIWTLLQARYTFLIRIERGQPRLRKGKVTATFLSTVKEICRENNVARGWIGGFRTAAGSYCGFRATSHPARSSDCGTNG